MSESKINIVRVESIDKKRCLVSFRKKGERFFCKIRGKVNRNGTLFTFYERITPVTIQPTSSVIERIEWTCTMAIDSSNRLFPSFCHALVTVERALGDEKW